MGPWTEISPLYCTQTALRALSAHRTVLSEKMAFALCTWLGGGGVLQQDLQRWLLTARVLRPGLWGPSGEAGGVQQGGGLQGDAADLWGFVVFDLLSDSSVTMIHAQHKMSCTNNLLLSFHHG